MRLLRPVLVLGALLAVAASVHAVSSTMIAPPEGYALVDIGLVGHKVTETTYQGHTAYLVETQTPRIFGVTLQGPDGDQVAWHQTTDDLHALQAGLDQITKRLDALAARLDAAVESQDHQVEEFGLLARRLEQRANTTSQDISHLEEKLQQEIHNATATTEQAIKANRPDLTPLKDAVTGLAADHQESTTQAATHAHAAQQRDEHHQTWIQAMATMAILYLAWRHRNPAVQWWRHRREQRRQQDEAATIEAAIEAERIQEEHEARRQASTELADRLREPA